MTRSVAAVDPGGFAGESVQNKVNSPKFYLNIIGSHTSEVQLSDAPSVVQNRVVLFTERRLGLYPKFWKGKSINGGLPQLADLRKHLSRVRHDVDAAIPDSEWNGFAVIDYEAWHLTWEHMPALYREESRKVVWSAHPALPDTQVEEIARGQFETAAARFIMETLDLCRQLRPKARWGMYGYPRSSDPARLKREAKLYTHVDALYPSVYAHKWSTSIAKPSRGQEPPSRYKNRIDAIIGVSKIIARERPVLAYTWPRYNTSHPAYKDKMINDLDLEMMLTEPLAAGADGVILWGGIINHTRAMEFQKVFLDRILPLTRSITRKAPVGANVSSAANGQFSNDGAAPKSKRNKRSRRRSIPSPKL